MAAGKPGGKSGNGRAGIAARAVRSGVTGELPVWRDALPKSGIASPEQGTARSCVTFREVALLRRHSIALSVIALAVSACGQDKPVDAPAETAAADDPKEREIADLARTYKRRVGK